MDLAGDTWADYLYFGDEAEKYETGRDWTKRNRYLRSAIASFFSHVDGVVSEIYDSLRAADQTFAPKDRRNNQLSLRRKAEAIANGAARKKAGTLPKLDFDLKLLRDILNHPSITKSTKNSTGDTVSYDGTDVYGLAVSDVTAAGGALDAWLNEVCACYGYERFCDTKKLIEDFANHLGAPAAKIDTF